MEERLQKIIARAGIASRRKAEELIRLGKVKVNGNTVTELGIKVTENDAIEVNGFPIEQKEKNVYYILNKPRNVISTVSDDKNRKTVLDLFEDVDERIYPVGRLDYDTTGILLFTNDGDLANKLTHPKYGVEKTYLAKVNGVVRKEQLLPLVKGVVLNGRKTHPAKVVIDHIDRVKKKSWVKITIHEGRYHQVKNMFSKIGLPVEKLKREQYAFLTLEGLQSGEYRKLRREEVKKLKELVK